MARVQPPHRLSTADLENPSPAANLTLGPAMVRCCFYQDWGTGKSILFIHSICLSSQRWQYNMVPLSEQGFRCVAYDRRGHGRSMQPGNGYKYDTLANDLARVIEPARSPWPDPRGTFDGGCGDCKVFISLRCRAGGSHRAGRSGPAVHVKTPDNPEAQERSAFEQTFASWRRDYPKWVAEGVPSFLAPEPSNAQWNGLGVCACRPRSKP